MSQKMKTSNLLDITQTIAYKLFEGIEYPWEVLKSINNFIIELGETLSPNEYEKKGDGIWIAKSATVFPSAYLQAPLIVCPNAEIRHCAFIRGSVIIGENSVVGNSTEVKNSIIFNNAQAPHFNYVGDSILGYKSHMGASSLTSNLKSDKTNVTIKTYNNKINTNLKKFGAIIGDYTEVGCGAVLNPGTITGRNTMIYPLVKVRGYIPENYILKDENTLVIKREFTNL